MRISITDAKGQLTELIRRAEADDEVILTCHGRPAFRLVSVKVALDPAARGKLLESVRESGVAKTMAGESAARSQDFLYGENGLPK